MTKKTENRKLPNFLIVGAAKCGTTSLYQYLYQHPEIFMPKWKELSYFIGDPYGPLHRAKKQKFYYRVFSNASGYTAVGEASTSYLFDKSAPELIKEHLGSIRIIILLRNPVHMAYSLYNHQVRKEGETLNTFETALENENQRFNDIRFRQTCYGWHANYYYFHRGLYFKQVKRYLDTFGKQNVKIILFENLTGNPIQTIRKICRFLEVDDTFTPEIKIHNPGGGILKIPQFWEDAGLFQKTISFVLSKNMLKKMPHLIRNIGRRVPGQINPETAGMLGKKFYEDICRLEELIDRDLSGWKIT